MTRLYLRADAGLVIGSGHVTRCLALALAWRERGGAATFVSRGLDASFLKTLGQHRIAHLDPEAFQPEAGAWVALDGYQFGPSDGEAILAGGARLLLIDDMANWPRYRAHAVLNQNLHAERLHYPCDADTRLLLGVSYAMLRPEFARREAPRRTFAGPARRVLVSLGGSDEDNVTLRVMQALPALRGWQATVIVGASNPYEEALRAEARRGGVEIARNVSDMADRMAVADMAVTAAGSTCWEACRLGLPSLLIVLAGNQARIAAALHEEQAAVSLGWHADIRSLAEAIDAMAEDPVLRRRLSEKGRRLVDGRGAGRVVDALSEIQEIRRGA